MVYFGGLNIWNGVEYDYNIVQTLFGWRSRLGGGGGSPNSTIFRGPAVEESRQKLTSTSQPGNPKPNDSHRPLGSA